MTLTKEELLEIFPKDRFEEITEERWEDTPAEQSVIYGGIGCPPRYFRIKLPKKTEWKTKHHTFQIGTGSLFLISSGAYTMEIIKEEIPILEEAIKALKEEK